MTALLPKRGRIVSFAAVAALTALLAAGCGPGPSRSSVSGKVTYHGAPVPGALMLQTTVDGTPVSYPVSVGADGRFTTSGVPEGVYQVGVTPAPVVGVGGSPRPAAAQPSRHVDVPPRYLSPTTSGVTLEVRGGSVQKNIDLTD
jgi:hypothetical protein